MTGSLHKCIDTSLTVQNIIVVLWKVKCVCEKCHRSWPNSVTPYQIVLNNSAECFGISAVELLQVRLDAQGNAVCCIAAAWVCSLPVCNKSASLSAKVSNMVDVRFRATKKCIADALFLSGSWASCFFMFLTVPKNQLSIFNQLIRIQLLKIKKIWK